MRPDDIDDLPASRVSAALRRMLHRRLLAWAVRWSISFALIALAVSYWPQAAWLWWAGAILAGVSLAVILVMHFTMAPKLLEKTEDLQARAEIIDALEESHGDDDRPAATKH